MDLKHMTSSGALSPGALSPGARTDTRRTSQHLRTSDARLGSRSPSSIPSSPTSVHSSSSAIFERDIEPLVPPSPPHSINHPPNPHRIPRAKGTEALEHSVPSVLDSAAAVLGSLDADAVAVVSPAPASAFGLDFLSPNPALGLGLTLGMRVANGRTSGVASPIGSFRSRSPSPSPRAETLLAAATTQIGLNTQRDTGLGLGLAHDGAPHDGGIAVTGAGRASASSSPLLVASPSPPPVARSPSLSPALSPTSLSPTPFSPSALSPISPSSSIGNPHITSNTHAPTKRLSFMSYTDLRAATPAATTSLVQLTSGAGTDVPPHITGVAAGVSALSNGYGGSQYGSERGGGSAAPSIRGLSLGGPIIPLSIPASLPLPVSLALPVNGPPSPSGHSPVQTKPLALLDLSVGGEWEREGFGRGLEERLEGEPVTIAGTGSLEGLGLVGV